MSYQNNNNTRERKYEHINIAERKIIERELTMGRKQAEIARLLGRSRSSINREIRRGTVTQRDYEYRYYNKYCWDAGENIKNSHRLNGGSKYKLFQDMELVAHIENEILVNKRSPDEIIGALNTNGHKYNVMVSTKTVYNYIARGQLKVRNIDLLLKVRRKQKRKRQEQKRILGRSIELRPPEAEERTEFGHWEADGIDGARNRGMIFNITERKTRVSIKFKLENQKSESVINAIKILKERYGKYFSAIFKTITMDNGSEFACSNEIESYGTKAYYCHPYSAYERGSNENDNGIARRYIPKGSSLDNLSQDALDRINYHIITMHRKILGYKTSKELFDLEVAAIINNVDSHELSSLSAD